MIGGASGGASNIFVNGPPLVCGSGSEATGGGRGAAAGVAAWNMRVNSPAVNDEAEVAGTGAAVGGATLGGAAAGAVIEGAGAGGCAA